MLLKYKSRYILFPLCLIVFDTEAIMMILEKEKRLYKLFRVEI